MDPTGVSRIALAVAVIVFLDLLFVELRRCFREAKRILTRLGGYADLPLFSLLATTEHDVTRLTDALETIPELIERAQAALAIIRRPFARRLPAGDYLPKGSSPG
jgi:hypothetical protein